MSAAIADKVEQVAEMIDSDGFYPSREFMEALAVINGAVARWNARQGNLGLRLVRPLIAEQ